MVDINQSQFSETDSSNNSASPNGYLSGAMLPSQVEPVGRMVMAALKRWHNQISAVITSAGTNTITLTHTVGHTAYVTGDLFTFIAGGTNSGSATINVDGLGAKTIKQAGANLVGNEIQTGDVVTLAFDGTNMNLIASSRRGTIASASDVTTPTAWTPTDGSGAGLTITNNGSYYYKIGKMVTVALDVTYPATASGAAALISGLPATPHASVLNDVFMASVYTGASVIGGGIVTQGTVGFQFINPASGATYTNANLTTLHLRTTFVYFTA